MRIGSISCDAALREKECARVTSRPNQPDDELAWTPADARVFSMPCVEWFGERDDSYKQGVLPAHVRTRVRAEAGTAHGWRWFAGDAGECVSRQHFGESADYQTLYSEFGFTAERVVTAARTSLARLRAG